MNEYTTADAIELIGGTIINASVVYYDDAMARYYVGPESDLQDLVDLMNSDDVDIASDAYSHWCSGTSHGDGYETEAAAIEAANSNDA